MSPFARNAVLVIFVVAGMASCESGLISSDAFLGLTTQRLEPLPVYRTWWADVNACSGFSKDFGNLRFYVVLEPLNEERTEFPCRVERAEGCNGFWQKPHNIVLAPAFVEDERLVKHEMLHDVLQTIEHRAEFAICGVR